MNIKKLSCTTGLAILMAFSMCAFAAPLQRSDAHAKAGTPAKATEVVLACDIQKWQWPHSRNQNNKIEYGHNIMV